MEELFKAMCILDECKELSTAALQCMIGMLIDMTAAKDGRDSLEVLDALRPIVAEVNKTEGRMILQA